jgi:hypothetical protein
MDDQYEEAARAATAALTEYTDKLLRFPNVVGGGVGYRRVGGKVTGEFGVTVFVERKVPTAFLATDEVIPSELDGTAYGAVPTDVVESRIPRLLAGPDTSLHRPLVGGAMIHATAGIGTLGCNMYDGNDLRPVSLTCNHVVTRPGRRFEIPDVDDIWQPPGNQPPAGRTKRIVPMLRPPLSTPGSGTGATWTFEANVDAAIISDWTDAAFWVADVGAAPNLIQPPWYGLGVRKRGAFTGLTSGLVEHAGMFHIVFDENNDKLMIGRGVGSVFRIEFGDTEFCVKGDSGSLVVDLSNNAVGLLFASELGPGARYAYACHFEAVRSNLNLRLPHTGGLHNAIRRAVFRRLPDLWALPAETRVNAYVSEMIETVDVIRAHYFPDDPTVAGAAGQVVASLNLLVSDLADPLHHDEDLAGLLDEALGDWFVLPTVYDKLEYRLPDDFGPRIIRAIEHLSERSPNSKELLAVGPLLEEHEGKTMRQLLESLRR